MDYLQKWWDEKYPNAGVEKITNVSEGVIDIEHLIDFEQWLVKNFDITVLASELLIDFFKWRKGQQLTADTVLEIETFAKEYESNL